MPGDNRKKLTYNTNKETSSKSRSKNVRPWVLYQYPRSTTQERLQGCKRPGGNSNWIIRRVGGQKLTNVWLTLKLLMLSILRVGGDNSYTLPHINKLKLEKEGKLRTEVLVSEGDMNLINEYKIGTNQVRITRFYPPITRARRKYLIEL